MDNELKEKLMADIHQSRNVLNDQFSNLQSQIDLTKDLVDKITAALSNMNYQQHSSPTGYSLFGIKVRLKEINKHLDETIALAKHDVNEMRTLISVVNTSDTQSDD